MQHRPEIDGLRAVAVVPVILFHAGFAGFGGGFVGVDVFFVISGYLITSILIADIEGGTFSLGRFYERRARRILPALITVILACFPFAAAWMLADPFRIFAESAGLAVLGLSNLYFIGQGDYFAPDSDLQPLLHTWSLGVEEQYYLLFPLMLWVLYRLGRRPAGLVVLACVLASFLLAEWGWREYARQNFYFTLSRLWEIGVGSLVAFWLARRAPRANDGLALLGLALIAGAVLSYDRSTPFPSIYALAPVLGTALVLVFAGQPGWVARSLSIRPLVWIGLVSYSAYLWHQPLFAFARIRLMGEVSPMLLSGLIGLTFGLAWITWRWVEMPFRRPAMGPLPGRAALLMAAGLASAGVFALGLAVSLGQGWSWRLPPAVQHVSSIASEPLAQACTIDVHAPLPEQPLTGCQNPVEPGGPIEIALLGDSHALAISEGLGAALSSAGFGYYDVSFQTCLPLSGFHFIGRYAEVPCSAFNDSVLDYLEGSRIDTLVLTARSTWYLDGTAFDNGEGGIEPGAAVTLDLLNHDTARWDDPGRRARVLEAFEARIRALAQSFNVVLVYPIPEAGWHVPQRLANRMMFGDGLAELSTSRAVYLTRHQSVIALFDRLVAQEPRIFAARVQDALCDPETGRCVNADASGVYYRDDDHLSHAGAARIAPVIVQAVEAARAD